MEVGDNAMDKLSRGPTQASLSRDMGNVNIKEFDVVTFTLFSELPPELRLKIWDFAAFAEPRIVDVFLDWPPRYAFARTPLPSIFAICHDSRTVAFQHYKISFEYIREESMI